MGHAGFFLDLGSTAIAIDPIVNEPKGFKFCEKPVVKSNLLNKTQMILVSNEHPDHFDKELVERIAKKNNSAVVAPPPVIEQLNLPRNALFTMNSNGSIFSRGVNVQAIPAHNPHIFYPLTYLMRHEGKSFYHAGDTQLTDLVTKVRADLLMLPIGGCKGMDINDAVRATKLIKPKYVVPMHYNTFDEIKQNPKEMVYKLKKSKVDSEIMILKPGKSIDI